MSNNGRNENDNISARAVRINYNREYMQQYRSERAQQDTPCNRSNEVRRIIIGNIWFEKSGARQTSQLGRCLCRATN